MPRCPGRLSSRTTRTLLWCASFGQCNIQALEVFQRAHDALAAARSQQPSAGQFALRLSPNCRAARPRELAIVLDRAASSRRRCQSALLRARRDTPSPSTIPACPIATSVTRCWKPSRSCDCAPERPRSLSMTWTRSIGQPSATARSRKAYRRLLLGVLEQLTKRGLTGARRGMHHAQMAGVSLPGDVSRHGSLGSLLPAPAPGCSGGARRMVRRASSISIRPSSCSSTRPASPRRWPA